MSTTSQTRDQHDEPGTDPVERLRHTLAIYEGQITDDEWVIRATSNVYGPGVTTGLTWGDLRALLAKLDS